MEKKNLLFPTHISIYSPPILHSDREYATPFTPQEPPRAYFSRNSRTQSIRSFEHYYARPIQILGPIPKCLSELRESSEFVLCPNCSKHVFTKVEWRQSNILPRVVIVLICILFCLIGFWICIPCVLIFPCQNRNQGFGHICPRCNSLIHQFNRNHRNGT